jgi:hypothetical protein
VGNLPVDVRALPRLFAFYLANGTIDVDLLKGFDHRPSLFQFGSSLEQVFAIYGKVLQVGTKGEVLNDGDAQYRRTVDSRLLRPELPGRAVVPGLGDRTPRSMNKLVVLVGHHTRMGGEARVAAAW